MRSEPTIRFATDSDRKRVLDLLNGVFSGQQRSVKLRDAAYWTWKFRSSVYGDSLLTVAEADERLVGVDHLWPWQFRLGGSVIRAVQPCDAAVDPEFRGMGVFKRMRKHGLTEAGRQGYQLSFNFPNKQSLPGNRAVGATYLGEITWRVRILNPLGVIKSMVLDEKSAAYTIPDSFELNVDLLHQMDMKREQTNRISIDRVEGFFNWRYLDRPKRSYGMIEIGEHAAAIFTVNKKGSLREMVIVDFVGEVTDKRRSLDVVVAAGKEMNADFIAAMDNPEYMARDLWKQGFLKRKLKHMVVLPVNKRIDEKIHTFDNWSMVAAMHDSI